MDKTIKGQVRTLLLQKEHDELINLCRNDKRCWRNLRLFLFEANESLRRSAIEAVAGLMAKWWQDGNRDTVLEYIRNLLWLLNDESGGIGWSAPETIAETIIAIPEIAEPYGSIMVAHALEGPPMLNSGLWAMGRLGKRMKTAIPFFEDKALAAFNSDDPETLGLAAWAMGEAEYAPALPQLKALADRKEPVRVYIGGDFQEKPLGQWAGEAIFKIGGQDCL